MSMSWEHVLLPLCVTPLVFGVLFTSLLSRIPNFCRWRRLWKHTKSSLEDLEASIREPEKFELDLAEQNGMCRKYFDSDTLRLKIKQKVSSNPHFLMFLKKLNMLYRLCKDRSRALKGVSVNPIQRHLPPGPPFAVDASQFWVVLIGIDMYPESPLQGCMSDALLMEQYFTGDLGVPQNCVQLLLGSREHTSRDDPLYPSRAHIIQALLGIITDPDVEYGDNIIIYFAGHGSCYQCPEFDGDESGEPGYVEALCPIDRDTPDENDKPIPDISDHEFNTILTQIFRVKGHRITVILDCCHSASVSQDLPEPGARVTPETRRATLEDMLLARESYLKRYAGYRSILSKDWYPDMDSHVALAACKEYEFAKEKKVQGKGGVVEYIGIFTHSLVRVLRSGYLSKETTYADLPSGLDECCHQTPVVSGRQKHARIWYQAQTSVRGRLTL
ncbi:uncharacterized protein ARMOST_21454 [Armillaria ostoyae]|uniref:Peptidase C14 caspase domain-containing protein n=1 Tax=Armillaria ostoyae TaxID=47428 RepID=A0A284SA39_ARMOS|nr:uncharacterized protein ARMOST_21454 [Armillaria ostoyae]